MIENLLIGCATIVVCLAIQCLFIALLVYQLAKLKARSSLQPTLMRIIRLLIGTLACLLLGNLLQIAIWAELFMVYGEFQDFATAFYHSIVNFSTLGYGDLVMSDKRRLLGGLEAANGVLMFGLTTSILYAVLNTILRYLQKERH